MGAAVQRRSIVAHGRLAASELRLQAARASASGVQVMTFEQLALRLAGGFAQAIDDDVLHEALAGALADTSLGELDAIKLLPGMIGAAADTLKKAWRSGIDLVGRSSQHSRLEALARLETAVLERLPTSMLIAGQIAERACARLEHAPAVLGPVEIVGISELSPCWRPLLAALAEIVPVTWVAGPREVPAWLEGSRVTVSTAEALAPEVQRVSAASGYHEALEALRWARRLIASGTAKPHEVAIASTAPSAYDDAMGALVADANLDVHFVHGQRVVTTRDGQAAAALADVLVRGLSATRLRRLATLTVARGAFAAFPEGWLRMLGDAPLTSPASTERFLSTLTSESWPGGIDQTLKLRGLLALLWQGTGAAAAAGEAILTGAAATIWKKALRTGNVAAIDMTIDAMRQADGCEAAVSIAFMPASALAASPRPFVWLLGLTSLAWPRRIAEDRLLSNHIVPTAELDPLPVAIADRRDFATIMATTVSQVILSRARRDEEGRLLGKSPLLRGLETETYLRRNRLPLHAASETDRLLARPRDVSALAQTQSALACVADWHRPQITPHDGLVRESHPLILAALDRVHSSTSLQMLLRNPIGFVWRYALGVKRPETDNEALTLDDREFGNLLHETLDEAVRLLEANNSLANAAAAAIDSAVRTAATTVGARWSSTHTVPPLVIWTRTLDDARALATAALSHDGTHLAGQVSYTEVPFGGQTPKGPGALPWDADRQVVVPQVDFAISGYIDRLDLSGTRDRARVIDYKSGKLPSDDGALSGGRELQRSLYAYAVRALLGRDIAIDAALLFPKADTSRHLDDPEAVLSDLTGYLLAARDNLRGGRALIGPDNGGDYDDFAFALPANAANSYVRRKSAAVAAALGDAAAVWEAA